jgi:hypothetical protein
MVGIWGPSEKFFNVFSGLSEFPNLPKSLKTQVNPVETMQTDPVSRIVFVHRHGP